MSFTLIRQLTEAVRDNGLKRLLLGLYSTDSGSRYIALSEQVRPSTDHDWVSNKRGITVRRGEIANIIAALQSADFDAKPDGNGLTDTEYASTLDWG